MTFQKLGVVGAGAWGTALAQTLRQAGREVSLWSYERSVVETIRNKNENETYLPGIKLDPGIKATSDLADLAGCEVLLLVTPAQFLRQAARQLKPLIATDTPVVICAKGIEVTTGCMLTEILTDELPQAVPAALSGPSFAIEVARDLPAAVTLACADPELGERLARTIAHKHFRLYFSDDLVGVEVGGAVKNVLAIAAGIVVGRKLGKSAHAAVITRGFAEMSRFARALGARRETMEGLSGLGDLVLTCSSTTSRNMSFGAALGEGQDMQAFLAQRKAVTEGQHTARAVMKVAEDKGIDMPICRAVRDLVWGGVGGSGLEPVSVDEAIEKLLSRPLKAEG